MNEGRFDALVRALTTGPASRRGALRLLAGVAFGSLLGRPQSGVAAPRCLAPGKKCKPSQPARCCSGKCSTQKKCLCTKDSDCPPLDPPNPCLRATCDRATGTCGSRPKKAGTRCDDGKDCTVNDECDAQGICRPGTADDGRCATTQPCRRGRCRPQSAGSDSRGCVVEPANENEPCGGDQICVSGECRCPGHLPNECQATGECLPICTPPQQFKPSPCLCECPANAVPDGDGCVCPDGFSNCDEDWANGCECRGALCCGSGASSTCQIEHANGLGQHFSDCVALNIHNADQARKARDAYAFTVTGEQEVNTLCNGGDAACLRTATSCACWAYSGPAQGHVHLNTADNSCLCPTTDDSAWT